MQPGCFRLLLALVVVLHHSTPLRLGAWAVGLFFCLSGFWIAEMWGRKYSRLDSPYLEFLVSRWWRLAPVLFVTTALAGFLMYRGIIPGDTQVLSHWAWWLTQPAIAGSASQGRLLPPAWSLDVEMQFYFLVPLLIVAAIRASSALRWVIAITAIAWCWLANTRGWAGDSPRLDVWIGVFLLGVLASVTQWKPTRTFTISAATVTIILFIGAAISPVSRSWILLRGSTGHVLTGPLAATLTVGTILSAIPFAIATTRVKSGRLDRFFGDLSYPLYLVHWLPRNWYYAQASMHPRPIILAALLALNVTAAILTAVVILLVIDRPVQRLRGQWVRRHSTDKTMPTPLETPPAKIPAIDEFAGAV